MVISTLRPGAVSGGPKRDMGPPPLSYDRPQKLGDALSLSPPS